MKRRLFFCMALMLCCAMTMFAQNDKISYQAVVRGTDNHLVVNTDLTVTVSLANSENGPVVYKETHAVTSNMNGLISLLIGDGTPVDGSWADIQWSNAWVTAVINKGGTPVATHKMPLNAVPYALQAGYADSVNTNVIANYLTTHSVPSVSNVQSDWNQTDNTADDYIKNKPSIRDSVSNYLTNNHYVTETVMSGAIHDSITNNISSQIHDSLSGYDIKDCADVNACVANSLADGTSALNQIVDSIAGNTIHDSIVNHISTQIRDSVSNYLTNNNYVTETVMSGAIHDSIANNITNNISSQIHDSIVNNIAGQISDSLNNYHIQNCDDVNACVTAALADGTSDLNRAIDTIAGNVIHDSIANNVTKLIHDSITNNVTKLIHDSIANNITNNISSQIHDSIANNITNNISSQIHDSLSGYDIKDCADVNACVANSLADGTSALNQIVDSIAGNTIHDSIVNHISTQIRDSVSNYLTNNNYVTETVMSGAIHDSIANNISSQIHDSITNLAGRIPAVNDATLTVTVTDVATTTFTANSATDATVTLAKVAGTGSYNDLTDTPTNLVTTDGDNTYTGSNDFTGGTVTVPSAGINLKTDDATSCSNQNAVNACDLLAVFDSLNRRIQGVFDSLKHLNDSLAEELAALSPTPTLTLTSDLDGGSVNLCGNASVEVVYTATLNNANAADYTFAWTVGGEAQSETGSTLTYTYTAAATDVKVVCVTTRAGSAALKDSLTTTVKAGGTPVALSLCDNYLTVTVVSVSGSPNSISWGDGSTGTSVSADMTHTYSTSGTYTITATNSDGCKATYTMALAAHTTCTLSEMGNTMLNANERGSATAIDSVKDHEGNWYEVVQIGNQCWLKENLRTTTSPKTGTRLVNTAGKTGNSASQLYGSKVAHWYMNDSTTYAPKGYGLLYNWCAAMDTANPSSYVEVPTASNSGNNSYFSFTPSGNHRGICPAGWHLPSDAEWNAMEKEVSGESWQTSYETTNSNYRGSHAGKLSTGCDWTTSTTVNAPGNYSNAERNSSGFAAVPAGLFVSSFSSAGDFATFWSSSQVSSGNAWLRYLNYDIAGVYHGNYYKYGGRSVRCLRDEEAAAASAPSNVGVTLGDATANSLTATATADDNGSAITGYEYCISTNADMSGATCENATETTHTFTGLTANTTYYVTVKATNAGGSTTSAVTSASTTAAADDCAGNKTPTPCTVSAAHAAQTGSTFTGNGYNGANDGLETVNGSGQVTSVTDYDGNVYPVVQIGSQCWLAENLRVTHSPKTGTYLVNTAGKTDNSSSEYYGSKVAHWYMNDSTTYAPKGYGLLYNWCAVMDTANPSNYMEVPTASAGNSSYFSFTPSGNHRGICPEGWHVPTDAEWSAMELEVNGSDVSSAEEIRGSHAGKLSTGCDWTSSTTAGAPGNIGNTERNSSGFAAVPAGYCSTMFLSAGNVAFFWSSSQINNPTLVWYRGLGYNNAGVDRDYELKLSGISVRCLRDEEAAAASAPSNVGVTLGGATANSLTATATADDNGSAITGYEYCISTNADMSGATCENATETTHTFTGLTANTTYYVTVKATNAGGEATSAVTNASTTAAADDCAGNRTPTPCTVSAAHAAQTGSTYMGNGYNGANDGLETVNGSGQVTSVTDYDGNVYPVVQIGSQCWLAENLRVTHSPKTGTYLVNTAGKTGNSVASYYGSKVAHRYNNDSTTYAPKGYGLLYNWCAAMDTANSTNYTEVPTTSTGNDSYFDFIPSGNHRGICPEGWHVPTDAEWSAMELEVNGSDVSSAGGHRGSHAGKLSTGCDWTSSTTAGAPGNYSNTERNSSGFAAVPAGAFLSSFGNAGSSAYFWSSSQVSSYGALSRYLGYDNAGVGRSTFAKSHGRSVRCLRD